MKGLLAGSLASLTLFVAVAVPSAQAPSEDAQIRLPPPTYPAAVALMAAGKPTEALATLEQQMRSGPGGVESPIEGLILRAVLLSQVGRAANAEAVWASIIDREVWMRTFARRAVVESLAARDNPAAAEPVLRELTRADAARHVDLVLAVADAFAAAGRSEAAAGQYRYVLGVTTRGASADAARLGLARALEAGGDELGALATLREAQRRHRTAAAFETAKSEERRLARARGGEPRPFSEAEYRDLARRLRSASRFDPALAVLDEWTAAYPDTATPETIASDRITTLYAQRDNVAGVATCRQFYERFPTGPLTPEVRQTDFRLAVRMGETERARQLGLDLWEGRVAGATTRQRRGAAELLAAYLVAVGDVDGGLALFRGLFQAATSPDDQRATLWRAGVAALRVGQHDRALANLRGLVDRQPSGDLALAAQYWLGVAEEQTGDTAAARRRFERLAERYP